MLGQAPRVFLSHSSKDKEFVKELYRRLTRDGVSCFFDIESIGWGDNWVRALERAIDECEYIVFVLSPAFCESEWVEVERTSSIAPADRCFIRRRNTVANTIGRAGAQDARHEFQIVRGWSV